MTTHEVCEHCAGAPARGPGAWLAHHACQDSTCACALNDHRRSTLATKTHQHAIRTIQDTDRDEHE